MRLSKAHVKQQVPNEKNTKDHEAEQAYFKAIWKDFAKALKDPEPVFQLKKQGDKAIYECGRTRFSNKKNVYTLDVGVDISHVHLMVYKFAQDGHRNGRLEGSDHFRYLSWVYGSLYDVKLEGYTPSLEDQALVRYLKRQKGQIFPIENQITPQKSAEKDKTNQKPERLAASEPNLASNPARKDLQNDQEVSFSNPVKKSFQNDPDPKIEPLPIAQGLEKLRGMSPKGFQAFGEHLRKDSLDKEQIMKKLSGHLQGESVRIANGILNSHGRNEILKEMEGLKLRPKQRGRTR